MEPINALPSGGLNARRLVFGILLLLAAAEFVVRGPLRYLRPTNWNDLAQYYGTSRLWLRGQNFTSPELFSTMWRDEVGEAPNPKSPRLHVAPPPGVLVLFAPIAAMPWPAARLAWFGVLLAGFAATVASLLQVAGLSLASPRGLALTAGCLALAPFHTGMATGNQTILVVGLCAFGIWAARGERDLIAGISFGVACSMKPHIAGFFLLYYLLRRRWRLLITSAALMTILVVVAAAWMRLSGVHWLAGYLDNIKFGATRNSIDDFTTANPIRFMLINLQVPFYSFTHNAAHSNLLALLVGLALVVTWIVLLLKRRSQDLELLSLSTIAVIGLLPLYHRLYDASVLAIPLCWCLIHPLFLKRVSRVALLLMAPFLVPSAAILQQLTLWGRLPTFLTESWWWSRLLMPMQTWLLLALSIVLLYGMAQHGGRLHEQPR